MSQQLVLLEDVQRGQSGDAGQRIAAERRAMIARLESAGCFAGRKARADSTPEPSPLASVITSGRMPVC